MSELTELQKWYEANKDGALTGHSLQEICNLAITVGFTRSTVAQWYTSVTFKAVG